MNRSAVPSGETGEQQTILNERRARAVSDLQIAILDPIFAVQYRL